MSDMTVNHVLSIKDLTVFRGAAKILDRVTLALGQGETMALVGESGAGKSTIATAIMRLLENARVSGSATLVGEGDLLTLSERKMVKLRGRRLSMIFQDAGTALNPSAEHDLATHPRAVKG